MKTYTLAALLLLALSGNAKAAETSFTYGGIYKSLKTAQQTAFSQLSLGFFLRQTSNGQMCPTTRVYLSDGEQEIDLSVTSQGKLLLPLDKKFKQDHAAITLVTDQAMICHLAMEIAVADFELDTISPVKVKQWLAQFNALYSALAGWPGRYFMPKVAGLTFKLDKQTSGGLQYKHNEQVSRIAAESAQRFVLSQAEIENFDDEGALLFGANVSKVTPVLEK